MKKEITTTRLVKYLKHELPETEMLEIENWVKESKQNEDEIIALAKVYHLGQLARRYTPQEIGEAWKKTCRKAGGATGSVNKKTRQVPWRLYIMAAVILILVLVNGLLLIDRQSAPSSDNRLVLTSQQGKFVQYTLPDSTVVTLNNNSSLEFPVAFNSDERRVRLNGEGFFDVTRNEDCPFVVETGKGVAVKVLGTEFSLQSFSSDEIVQVSLISGSVEVNVEGQEMFSYVMHPSERFTCNVTTREMNVETMVGINGMEWMYNKLVFRDTSLKEVARQISNHFGVTVSIDKPELANIRFSGTFDNRELGTVLSYMEQTCGIRTMITPDGIVFHKK